MELNQAENLYPSVKCFNLTKRGATMASFQMGQKEAYCHHFWEYI